MTSRTAGIALVMLLSSTSALAQTGTQAPPAPSQPLATQAPASVPPAQSDQSATLPVDLARIKSVLERNPSGQIDEPQLRFYLEIIAKHPTPKEFLGSYDLKNGVVKGTTMSHQEFLDLVTPREFNHSGGMNAIGAMKKAITSIRSSRDEAEVAAIRAQIDRELAALRGGGGS